jgi:hypothetical protein
MRFQKHALSMDILDVFPRLFNPHANGSRNEEMAGNMARIGTRMARDKRRGWLAGRRMSERTSFRPIKP